MRARTGRPTAARGPTDRQLRRSVGRRSGCTVGDDRSSAGLLSACTGNSSARSQAAASATTRGLSSICPPPMIGASIATYAGSRWAAVDRSRRCSSYRRRSCIVGCEESGRAVAIKQLAKIRGAGQYVVAWIVGICAESIAGTQRGVCRRHDLHQAHGAFGRRARASPPLSACITARIQCAGTPKRRDALAN